MVCEFEKEPGTTIRFWRAVDVKPSVVLDEIAAVSRSYIRARSLLVQWASDPLRQRLVERGVTVRARAWTNETKEEAVMVTRQLFHQGLRPFRTIPRSSPELVTLEQRQLPSGRSRYAAPRAPKTITPPRCWR